MDLFGPVPSRRQRTLAHLVTLALVAGAAYKPVEGSWLSSFQQSPRGLEKATAGHPKMDGKGPEEGSSGAKTDGARHDEGDAGSLVREEQAVEIEGVRESWALVWREKPAPFCREAWSCLCTGFELGEQGRLTLVRRRPGAPDEVLDLGTQALPRWQRPEEAGVTAPPEEALAALPLVQVMKVRDYDHDGQASEFPVQVGALPCGKRISVVVGVGRANPSLHVFGTAEHPREPLLLTMRQWGLVAEKRALEVTTWLCGDHGTDVESATFVRADAAGLHAWERSYACVESRAGVSRGARQSENVYRLEPDGVDGLAIGAFLDR